MIMEIDINHNYKKKFNKLINIVQLSSKWHILVDIVNGKKIPLAHKYLKNGKNVWKKISSNVI